MPSNRTSRERRKRPVIYLRLLGRNMPPIHLHDQFMGWRGTILLRRWLEIFFGEHGTHVVSDLSDVIVVIHPTAMHR